MKTDRLSAALVDMLDEQLESLQARANAAANDHTGVRAIVDELSGIIDALVDIINPTMPEKPTAPVKPPVEEKPDDTVTTPVEEPIAKTKPKAKAKAKKKDD